MSGLRYAFSLSKEAVATAEPPGTSRLVESGVSSVRRTGLVPRPSSSPADPLNWPQWRKNAVLATMSLYAFSSDFMSSIVASGLPLFAAELRPPRSFDELSHLIAVSVLMIGASNIFWVPLANVFGRRPVMIIGSLILTLGGVWCGLATLDFNSLLAARVIQGVGGGPGYAIGPAVIGETFFLHQRGRAMSIYVGSLAAGAFIGGISGGYIAEDLGLPYMFWISVALAAATFLMTVFLLPETLFDRADLQADTALDNTPEGKENAHSSEIAVVHQHEPFTFARSMRIGVYRGGVGRQFIAPWLTLRLHGVWVVMLHSAGVVGGVVTMATVAPQLLAVPPYLWGRNVGLVNLGGIIGTILAVLATYLIADRLLRWGAAHQVHGLAEPEARLPASFPGLFLATTGLWTFGFSAAHPSPHAWAGLVVGFGMMSFGITQAPSIGYNYITEAYAPVSADCFTIIVLLRSVVSFAWTFFVGTWVLEAGPAEPFGIFGMLMGVFSLLTIPLWLYGKRLRIATARFLQAAPSQA